MRVHVIPAGRLVLFAALLLAQPALAQVQINQIFLPQGPAPSFGPLGTVQSSDASPNGNVTGAIETVIADPTNANRLFVATPNGGIWETTNGGATWTPLTDRQATLSIASLAFDPTDPTHNTLIAGTGLTSNGTVCTNGNAACFYAGSGGIQNGILYSKDGGTTWASLGATTLGGQTVDAVAASGNVLFAGTYQMSFAATDQRSGGLYRSADGGTTFTLVSGTGGLPTGPVTSIAQDPNNPNRIYVAVSSPNAGANASTAVYVGNIASNGSVTWTPVFQAAQSNGTIQAGSQTVLKIATAPGGAIAVGVVDLATNAVTGLFYSGNSGGSWKTLAVPALNNGNQAPTNLAIAIDPRNTNLVYVSGDRIAGSPFTVAAFRIDAVNAPGTATSITDANTANGSTAHADSRSIAFDANGRLILSSDGGIYARTSPQNNSGAWSSLIGNMGLFAPSHAVAYDAIGKRLMTAAQDTGVTIQSAPNSLLYNATHGADGINAFINDVTLAGQKQTAFYGNTQGLGYLARVVLDSKGNAISPNTAGFGFGAAITCNGGFDCAGQVSGSWFGSPWVNNRVDPTRMAMAGTDIYVTQDTLTGAQAPTAASVDLTLTDLGTTPGFATVGTIAYGTRDNVNMLVAGTALGLAQSTTGLPGSLVAVPAYTTAGGVAPLGVVLDPRSQNRYYVADFTHVYGTTDQGLSFTDFTAKLPAGLIHPAALEFISNNGVNDLLVGGVNNVANAQSTIAAADSDAFGNLSNWRPFGTGLPNTQVSGLAYNAAADVLAVATFGHGLFALYDVTSYFPQATVLQFGLANNDSMPDASFLTNGTSASRPLIKYGTGTLTIAGAASYTGGTTIEDGVLQLGNGGTGGSILGNVTFCSNAADPNCNTATNKALIFDRSDFSVFNGSITGPGQVAQIGSGELVLSGNSTYSGPTNVMSGILRVTGSITSPVTVSAGAALGGSGSVGSTTILAGGTLAPGDPTTLTVNGNLAFTTGSNYVVMVQGNASDRTNVTGSATLAGNVFAGYLGGTLANNYVILSAAGGRTGTFDSLSAMGFPAFVTASLLYTPTDVDLRLTSGLSKLPSLTQNQRAVGSALDVSFNNGGGTLAGLLGLAANQLPGALTALSGEGITGTQETTFGANNLFLSLMMDQGQFWRSGDTIDPNGVTYPAANAYAAMPTKAMPMKAPAAFEPRWRGWFAGFDGIYRLGGDRIIGSANLSHDTAGGAAGIDYQVNPNLLIGGAAGGSSSRFSVFDRSTSGNIDGAHLGAYGVGRFHQMYAAAAFTFGAFNNQTSRTVAGVGPIEIESGTFNSYLFGSRVEAGFAQRFGKFTATPFAAVQFSEIWQPAFTETSNLGGAGLLNLRYRSKTIDSLPTFLGAQVDTRINFANGMAWAPYARASWVHEFDPVRSDAGAFATLPLATFTVDGARAARDSARVDLGGKLALTRNIWLFSSFVGEFSNRGQMYAGKSGLRAAW